MTRRETLVAVLQGTNGYTLSELNAMNAIVGSFLTDAEAAGVSHGELAERLVAFKQNGGSGLSNAIAYISADAFGTNADACADAVETAKAALKQAQAALDAVS